MKQQSEKAAESPLYMLTVIATVCWSNWQVQFDRLRDGGLFMQIGPFGFSATPEVRLDHPQG